MGSVARLLVPSSRPTDQWRSHRSFPALTVSTAAAQLENALHDVLESASGYEEIIERLASDDLAFTEIRVHCLRQAGRALTSFPVDVHDFKKHALQYLQSRRQGHGSP